LQISVSPEKGEDAFIERNFKWEVIRQQERVTPFPFPLRSSEWWELCTFLQPSLFCRKDFVRRILQCFHDNKSDVTHCQFPTI
jgi:hypothetical protein